MASSLSPTNVQSNLPAETLLVPSQATLSVSSPLAREMTKEKVAEGHDEEKSDETGSYPLEWRYLDGGARAWLVVLGCFMFASTCMCVSLTPRFCVSFDIVIQGVWSRLGRSSRLLSYIHVPRNQSQYSQYSQLGRGCPELCQFLT